MVRINGSEKLTLVKSVLELCNTTSCRVQKSYFTHDTKVGFDHRWRVVSCLWQVWQFFVCYTACLILANLKGASDTSHVIFFFLNVGFTLLSTLCVKKKFQLSAKKIKKSIYSICYFNYNRRFEAIHLIIGLGKMTKHNDTTQHVMTWGVSSMARHSRSTSDLDVKPSRHVTSKFGEPSNSSRCSQLTRPDTRLNCRVLLGRYE